MDSLIGRGIRALAAVVLLCDSTETLRRVYGTSTFADIRAKKQKTPYIHTYIYKEAAEKANKKKKEGLVGTKATLTASVAPA